VRDGDDYVINGRKWWTTGAGDPRCKILIFMGKTDPDNAEPPRQQSMILVPIDTPGVELVRPLHRVRLRRCAARTRRGRCSPMCGCRPTNMLLGEGRGFEIAQGRLGPGRIHHCMRLDRAGGTSRWNRCAAPATAWPSASRIAEQGMLRERIAEARIMIDSGAAADAATPPT
jgi:acyl-CoA dehydrogenase